MFIITLYDKVELKRKLNSESPDQAKALVYNLDFLREFLQIILQSKSTFLRNKDDIHKYLRIKSNVCDSDALVIDCEELKLFLEKNYSPTSQKDLKEYESLMFLPIMFNELGYLTFKDKDEVYKERYQSVPK